MAKGLKIKVTADDKATKKIKKGFGEIENKSKSLNKSMSGMTKAVAGLAAGYVSLGAAINISGYIVKTGASFEQLKIQLKTLTGSSEKAEKAFEWVSHFAKTTPYELENVATAFSRLKAYGMDATKYLGILGDTASAMGKDIMQAVEMFADAATGEFERLKEFGIRASQAGDEVTFSWQQNGKEMTKTVAKTQESITSSLSQILSKFNGSMNDQSKTLIGVWSNLQDTLSQTANKIFKAGLGDALKENIKDINVELSDWVNNNDELIAQNLSDFFDSVSSGIKGVGSAISTATSIWDKIPDGLKKYLIGGPGVGLAREAFSVYDSGKDAAKLQRLREEIGKLNTQIEIELRLKHPRKGVLSRLREEIAEAKKEISTLTPPTIHIKSGLAYSEAMAKAADAMRAQRELLGGISEDSRRVATANQASVDAIFEQTEGLREQEETLKRITEEGKAGTGWGKMDRWRTDDIYADENDERAQAAIEFVENQKQREQELLEVKKSALEEHRALLAEGAAYDKEMQNKEAAEAAERFKKTWGQSFESMQNRFASFASDGINKFIDGTKSASDAFRDFAASFVKDIAKMIIKQQLLNAVSKFRGGSTGGGGGFSGMLGGFLASKSAKGNVFDSGKVEKFAKGGVVTGPTAVPMALMGEGGRQEAVLPLGRDGHGDLGVKAMIGDNNPPAVSGNGESNSQPITKNETINNYNMSIQAMDSKSFMEFARKNPSAFAAVFKDNVAKGDSATLSAINSARGR